MKSNTVDMDSTKLRIRVAELCGWVAITAINRGLIGNHQKMMFAGIDVPDYPNDLNACYEFTAMFNDEQLADFALRLFRVHDYNWQKAVNATAEQRCRAFVATMGASSVPSGLKSDTASGVSNE